MRRREFLASLAGALASPFAGLAQQAGGKGKRVDVLVGLPERNPVFRDF